MAKSGVHFFDLPRLRGGIVAWGEGVRRVAEEELANLGPQLEDEMANQIREAVTPTGADRAARGGSGPGRVDSGRMINAITHDVKWLDKNTLSLRWGWLDTAEAYFLFQEFGSDAFNVRFEGMDALSGSYVHGQDHIWDILNDLQRKA